MGQGFLRPSGFAKALRFISMAQNSRPLDMMGLADKSLPLPKFDIGNDLNMKSSSLASSALNDSLYSISPTDQSRYMELFNKSQPRNGLIDGWHHIYYKYYNI